MYSLDEYLTVAFDLPGRHTPNLKAGIKFMSLRGSDRRVWKSEEHGEKVDVESQRMIQCVHCNACDDCI